MTRFAGQQLHTNQSGAIRVRTQHVHVSIVGSGSCSMWMVFLSRPEFAFIPSTGVVLRAGGQENNLGKLSQPWGYFTHFPPKKLLKITFLMTK